VAFFQDLAAMVMAQIEPQHAFGRVDPRIGLPNRLLPFDDLDDMAMDDLAQSRHRVVLVDLASPKQVSHASRVMGASCVDDTICEAVQKTRSGIAPDRKACDVARTQLAFLGA
jgi:GGDEF domain-containing protein